MIQTTRRADFTDTEWDEPPGRAPRPKAILCQNGSVITLQLISFNGVHTKADTARLMEMLARASAVMQLWEKQDA